MWRLRLSCERFASSLVRAGDHLLRLAQGIHEFSEDNDCILRLSRVRLREAVELLDGSHVSKGAYVGELHFWNERLACVLSGCRSLGKGARLRTQLYRSLTILAVRVAIDPDMKDIEGFHARICQSSNSRRAPLDVHAKRAGFTIARRSSKQPGRIHDLLEIFLIRALVWVFNREKVKALAWNSRRSDLWISRERLVRRFAPMVAACGGHVKDGRNAEYVS